MQGGESMVFIGLILILWLVGSMLTMGVICFVSAMIFWACPSQATHRLMWFWYIQWTMMLGKLVRRLVPEISVKNRDVIPQNQPYIIVANHYSWIDIVILYAIIFTQSQSFVFVMKRSLIKIPMIGVVCWGLGHPLLYRGKSRRKNLEILSEGARKSCIYNHGILIFPEGTRYTKVDSYPQDYQSLLKPRTVGFECIVKNMISQMNNEQKAASAKVPVLDVSLRYSVKEHGIWDFLGRKAGSVYVYSELHYITQEEAKPWLLETWVRKDQWLTEGQFPGEVAD